MTRPRGRRRRLAAWLVGLLVAVDVGLAGAQPAGYAQAPAGPTSPEFGVRPGHYGDTTLPGNHYTYSLEAGSAVNDSIVIENFTGTAATFAVYAADLITAVGGGVAPSQPTDPQRGVGAWLHVEGPSATVGGHATIEVPFTLTVPSTTPSGDYPGAVVVSRPGVPPAGGGLALETRAALIVRLTVHNPTDVGGISIGAELGRLTARRAGGARRFSITVGNIGNVLFTTSATVSVTDRRGRVLDRVSLEPDGIYVIPDGRSTLKALWTPPTDLRRAEAYADVTIAIDGRAVKTYRSNTVHLELEPWWDPWTRSAAPVLVLLLMVVFVLIAWRRRHRTEAEQELL